VAEVASTRCSMFLSPSGIQLQTKKPVQTTQATTMDLKTRTVATEENASRTTRCVAPTPLSNSSIGKTRGAMAQWAEDMDLTE
jgi:hypothetical protein